VLQRRPRHPLAVETGEARLPGRAGELLGAAAESTENRATAADHTDNTATDHTDNIATDHTDHTDHTDNTATDYTDNTECEIAPIQWGPPGELVFGQPLTRFVWTRRIASALNSGLYRIRRRTHAGLRLRIVRFSGVDANGTSPISPFFCVVCVVCGLLVCVVGGLLVCVVRGLLVCVVCGLSACVVGGL
jgi:hypothetical protein